MSINPIHSGRQRDLVARPAPHLSHQFGIALEFETRRGQCGAGFSPMQQLLTELFLESADSSRDRRRSDVQMASRGDQALSPDHLKKRVEFFNVHNSILSN
ncbi:MAG TPA: hypothetical protein VMQ54_07725 [Steroidobacteraceae bacterium]|jgi:hypothetical protein|nr:hypothetical protein [Steroidobacteraceae bacterium]